MTEELVNTNRDWFPQAAALWADMERGIYPWPGKPPRNKDGTFRVVKSQILKDLGITTNYHNSKKRIWENPHFLRALEIENRRRDTGIAEACKEIEAVVGPLHETRKKVIEHVKDIFERTPDSEDPLALTPQQYVKEGREWIRYIDETEGRTAARKDETIEGIMKDMSATNRVNAQMMGSAMELLRKHREDQDRRLTSIGVMDGEAEEID